MLLEILLARNVIVSILHLILLVRDNFIDPRAWFINIVLWIVYFYIVHDRKQKAAA